MVMVDGYYLNYYPERNQIVITMPQTMQTLTNTVSMVMNRRVSITREEEAVIVNVVKAIMEREDG